MNLRLLSLLIVPTVLFAIPSIILVLRIWRNRRKIAAKADWSDVPRQTAILFLFIYVLRCVLVVLLLVEPSVDWAIIWIVAWPIVGLVLGLFGLVIVSGARKGEKATLVTANLLFLALSISSIIAPN